VQTEEWQHGDWLYTWQANGMLKSVKKPDGNLVEFEYDALGRRTAKTHQENVTRFVWDGNVLLHEWNYEQKKRPRLSMDDKGEFITGEEETENLVTWVYEDGSFVPSAKIINDETFSIISDYIGRPIQAYDTTGNKVWETDYDIYGRLRNLQGEKQFIPFRQLGQYEDEELDGLYYNRFRYYDCNIGGYISQDPIGLEGNNPNFYAYVEDSNDYIDVFGLSKTPTRKLQKNWKTYVGKKHTNPDIHHGFPEEHAGRFKDLADIDVNNPKYQYNLPKNKHTTKPGIHTNSSRTGQNWNKTWDGILDQVEKMNLNKAQARDLLEKTLRGLARKERIGKYNANAVKKYAMLIK